MLCFQLIVLTGLVLLSGLRLSAPIKNSRYCSHLDAALLVWGLLVVFFWPGVAENGYMVPGDYLNHFYPWKALSSGEPAHNPLLSDISGCVYPLMHTIKQQMTAGLLPLWNPYAYAGAPLAGSQVSAAFHPFNLFHFAMSLPDAATLFPFLRLFIAAMGGFALLTSWHLSKGSAMFGAVLFAFCGVHVSWLSNYPEVTVTMLLPWILLALEKVALEGSFSGWVWLILLSVVQFLGGHCESSFHVYAFAVPFFLFRLNRHRRQGHIFLPSALKRMGMLFSAGLLSLGLSGFQLFPFLEYLPLTTRMNALHTTDGNLFLGLDFVKVVTAVTATLISPDFFGNPVAQNYWGQFNFIEQNSHITLCGLVLALFALVRKSRDGGQGGIKWVLAWGGCIAFLIAVRTPGLFEAVVSLPLFKQNSNHRLIIIFSFAFSMLAALGLEEIRHQGPVPLKKTLFVFFAILFTAGVLHQFDAGALDAAQLEYRAVHMLRSFMFLGAGVLICSFFAGFPGFRQRLPLFAIGLAMMEIFAWGYDFNTFVPREKIFPSTPMMDFLAKRPGVFRVASPPGVLPPGTEQMFELDSVTGLDPMKTHRYEQIFARISGQYDGIFTGRIRSFSSPWLDFLNVRYVAAPPGSLAKHLGDPRLVMVYDGSDGRVFENPRAFDRVFRVDRTITARTEQDAYELTLRHEEQLDRVAVIRAHQTKGLPDFPSGKKIPSQPAGTVSKGGHPHITKLKNGNIRMDVQGLPGGFYVAAMQYFPGWRIAFDNSPGKIVRTNYAFMGFQLPEGTASVDLYYDPISFRAGVWTSLAAFACLSGICLFRRFQKTTPT